MFRRKKDAEELSCGFEVNQILIIGGQTICLILIRKNKCKGYGCIKKNNHTFAIKSYLTA